MSSAAETEESWVLQAGVWDWVLSHLLFLLWVLIPRVLFVLLCLVIFESWHCGIMWNNLMPVAFH